MASTTTRIALPYPVPADTVDVPRDVQALANALDGKSAVYLQGTVAARPAAGVPGRFYYATDANTVGYDTGSTWVAVIAGGTTPALSLAPVLDVGMAGQVRAGRQLTVADFTAQGLAQPIGLWNLSDLANLGSDGRALTNKGGVPFGVGINGAANTSAVFAGSTAQALYIVDSGASDPYRIKTGSWGCWFRTAKRGTAQWLLTKLGAAGTNAVMLYTLTVTGSGTVGATVGDGASTLTISGVSDVADDRWHFAVVAFDGTSSRIYVDGVLEASGSFSGVINSGSASVLNIGAYGADGSTAAVGPHYGRVDEAFVTNDVLSDDQIRNLYCARIPHGYATTPTRINLNVTRRKRGGALAVADFPAQPIRLHNFTGGVLTDEGSGNVTLTNLQTTLIVAVAGADGAPNNAYTFSGAHSGVYSADTGLPSGTATRSYGCWFKTATLAAQALIGWGSTVTTHTQLRIGTTGVLQSVNGSDAATAGYVADGQWHHIVAVEDNAAGDGVKRKTYLDGRIVAASTVLNAITLGGATAFRVGQYANAQVNEPMVGQIDGAFVTGGALTAADVAKLYAKGSQALAPSPKNEGDHVEAVDATNVLATFDSLDSTALVDLGVSA